MVNLSVKPFVKEPSRSIDCEPLSPRLQHYAIVALQALQVLSAMDVLCSHSWIVLVMLVASPPLMLSLGKADFSRLKFNLSLFLMRNRERDLRIWV